MRRIVEGFGLRFVRRHFGGVSKLPPPPPPSATPTRSMASILRDVASVVPVAPALVAVPALAAALSDDTNEALGEMGGALTFLRAHQALFNVHQPDPRGVVHVSRVPDAPPRPHAKPIRPNVEVPEGVPSFPVPIDVLAKSMGAESPEAALARLADAVDRHAVILYRAAGDEGGVVYAQVAADCAFAPCVAAANEALAEHAAPEFDALRMARYLRTDQPTPLAELREACQSALTVPVLQVAATFPKRFLIQYQEDLAGEGKRLAVGVTFLLSEADQMQLRPTKYDVKTEAELLADHQASRKVNKGFKASKERREIVRALLRKRFPRGNPFLDADVLAQFIFDSLPDNGEFVSSDFVRDKILPNYGRDCCPLTIELFKRRPHLFCVQDVSSTSIQVARRERIEDALAEQEARAAAVSRITDTEILLELLSTTPTDALERGCNVGFLKARAGALVREAIKQRFPRLRVLKLFEPYDSIFEICRCAGASLSDPPDTVRVKNSELLSDLVRTLTEMASSKGTRE